MLLVQCSNPRDVFFIRVFKGVLSSELVDKEQKQCERLTGKKHASRRANLLRTLLQPKRQIGKPRILEINGNETANNIKYI